MPAADQLLPAFLMRNYVRTDVSLRVMNDADLSVVLLVRSKFGISRLMSVYQEKVDLLLWLS